LSKAGYVKEETRLRIEKAVKELNYTPNYIARGMRTNKSSAIGLFIPDYGNPFYSELFKGIEAVTRKAGYMNLVCHTDEQPDVELYYIKELLKRQIDGIIFCTYNRSPEGRKYLQEIGEKTPIVFMDPVFRDLGYSTVISDGYLGTREAVRYLRSLGCSNIAYIKGPQIHAVTTERYQGYCDGLKEQGLSVQKNLVHETEDFHMDSGRQAATAFLDSGKGIDAIIAATDVLAIGALKELNSRGVAVPDQIRLVGFDNIPLSNLVEPSLTTIAQPIFEMGVKAAELLIDQIANAHAPRQQIVMSCELIRRNST